MSFIGSYNAEPAKYSSLTNSKFIFKVLKRIIIIPMANIDFVKANKTPKSLFNQPSSTIFTNEFKNFSIRLRTTITNASITIKAIT